MLVYMTCPSGSFSTAKAVSEFNVFWIKPKIISIYVAFICKFIKVLRLGRRDKDAYCVSKFSVLWVKSKVINKSPN